MSRVSKRALPPTQLKELYGELAKTIARLNAKNTNIFLGELLGEEEKIMIAKRLAILAMLFEKNSTYRIAQLLLTSQSTVERHRRKLRNGDYEHIERLFKSKKKEYEEFWSTLEHILRLGMPPQGRGRWKSIFESMNSR